MILTQDHINKVHKLTFAAVYPHYVTKVERKGRTVGEIHEVISWLTGYDEAGIQNQINKKTTFPEFFMEAPLLNPNAQKITGMICGYRIEDIAEEVVRKTRYLDKLVDELAKGRTMDKILRK